MDHIVLNDTFELFLILGSQWQDPHHYCKAKKYCFTEFLQLLITLIQSHYYNESGANKISDTAENWQIPYT